PANIGVENLGAENCGTDKIGAEKTRTRCSSSRWAPAIFCARWKPCSSATPTSSTAPPGHRHPPATPDEHPLAPPRPAFRGLSGACHLPPLLKTLAAQHRPSLRRPERHRGFFPALRAVRPGLRLCVRMPARRRVRRGPQHRHSLALAVLAAFGFVLELLVVEEQLFARCEHEIRATIDAL